jgi:putative hydrolase of the HAD superfamily
MNIDKIKIIAFDADDTLWENEQNYQEVELEFCELLKPYASQEIISKELLLVEQNNLDLYGFGVKSFMLSLIETSHRITKNQVPSEIISFVINSGKELIEKPVVLIDGVSSVLKELKSSYKIVLATKGDLLDQERKLNKSGLLEYFDFIEIMSDKKEYDYKKLLSKLNVSSHNFLMVGNSMKSDIVPVVNIGGQAIYIPYHLTWQHERIENFDSLQYLRIEKINDILNVLKNGKN